MKINGQKLTAAVADAMAEYLKNNKNLVRSKSQPAILLDKGEYLFGHTWQRGKVIWDLSGGYPFGKFAPATTEDIQACARNAVDHLLTVTQTISAD